MELGKILSRFDGTMLHELDLEGAFFEIARELICNGYFLVNGERKIFLTDLEFYYHEEETSTPSRKRVKDPIMYHTYDHERKTAAVKNKLIFNPELRDAALPYYPVGSLNLHASGIDITFENPDKHFRASVLIRGYQIEGLAAEDRPTYLYNDMFTGIPLPLTIEWITSPGNIEIDPTHYVRKNVAKYDEDGDKIETDSLVDSFVYNGKRYVQCNRPWRFKRHNTMLEEKHTNCVFISSMLDKYYYCPLKHSKTSPTR